MNRARLYGFAGLAASAFFGLLAACGDSGTTTTVVCVTEAGILDSPVQNPEAAKPDPIDAGPPADLDAGPAPSYVPATSTLRKLGAEDSFWFIGVTSGPAPHAIYYVETALGFALKAVPVAGGAEVTLDPDVDPFLTVDSRALIVGGAVAWTHDADTNEIADALFVWTAAGGAKTITTKTKLGQFWATEDGTRIAFSAGATPTSTSIAITTSAAPDPTSLVLTGANAENLAVNTDPIACPVKLGFSGTTFIGAYCTGQTTTVTQPRLVTVDAANVVVVRLGDGASITSTADGGAPDGGTDAGTGDGGTSDGGAPLAFVGSSWLADAQGKNLFVRDATGNGSVIATEGASTTVASIGPVETDAIVAADGSVLVYRTAGQLKKATFAASPVVTPLAPLVSKILLVTPDSHSAFFATSDNTATVFDLNVVDLTAPTPSAVPLVTTPSVSLTGITGDGKRVVYINVAGNSVALESQLVGGGSGLILNPSTNVALLSKTGTGVISLFGASQVLGGASLSRVNASYVDGAKGGTLEQPVVTYVDGNDIFTVVGKSYVYRDVGSDPGIYALDMP